MTQAKNHTNHYPNLENSLYPIYWQQHQFISPNQLLLAIIETITPTNNCLNEFYQQLIHNPNYQTWIYSSFFGQYIQRTLNLLLHQSEDNFNYQLPELFHYELKQHARLLPKGQTLFFAGTLPKNIRQNKLLTTSLNPFITFQQAKKQVTQQQQIVINSIETNSHKVLAFAIKHNQRTEQKWLNQIMILDFDQLHLTKETYHYTQHHREVLWRHYQIN